jgi:hypothetical protein
LRSLLQTVQGRRREPELLRELGKRHLPALRAQESAELSLQRGCHPRSVPAKPFQMRNKCRNPAGQSTGLGAPSRLRLGTAPTENRKD